MKKIKQFLLALAMSLMAIFALFATGCSCEGKGEKVEPIAFKENVSIPTQVDIYDEIYFRTYIVVNDDADYYLYASYYDSVQGVQVTDKKQSSLVFQFQMEGEYNFRIEQVLGDNVSSVSCTIKANPEAPNITSPVMGSTQVGATKTYSEIVMMTQVLITPSNLIDKVQFLSYDFESKVEGTENETGVAMDPAAIEFTFDKEGIYTFDVKIENEKGEATAKLSVKNYNVANFEARVELEYNSVERIMSWTAIDNATAYRVWINEEDYVDVTDNSFSFADEETYPDGEYELKISPVFNGTVYLNSAVEKRLPVGRVRSPLVLFKDMDIVMWDERYFVEEYVVLEGGQDYSYDSQTFMHLIQGAYKVNEEIKIQVYGIFDDKTVTETAEITLISGDVATTTLSAINARAGVATGVEAITFGGMDGNTWFMTEWVGKNAPNYGIRVENLSSNWDGSYTIKKDVAGNPYGTEYTPGGMMLTNSSEKSWTDMYLYRGYNTSEYQRGAVGDAVNLGLYRYKADVHYIQVVGYEIVEGSESMNATITAYLFTVDDAGTLTLVTKSSGTATWATHCLTGGQYARLYGNIVLPLQDGNPEEITFTYAKPATSLNDLIYNISDSYAYKTQLIALCEATEPETYQPLPNRVLTVMSEPPAVDPDDGNGGDNSGDSGDDDQPSDDDVVVTPDGNYTPLSEQATLSQINVDANGAATGVQSIVFDGLAGDTWFMVQFTGNNAPNFAVRSTAKFTEWGAATLGNDAGMLITNSSYENQRTLNIYRGTKTDSGTRRGRIDGTMGVGPGNECFVANKNYIMIVGYAQNVSVSTSADLTCYIFEIADDGSIKLTFSATITATYAYNALQGTKAVIYGNINVGASVADDEWTSVSFTYATPADSLYNLMQGVEDTYRYKNAIIQILDVTEPEEEPDDSESSDDSSGSNDSSSTEDDSNSSDDSSSPEDDSSKPDDSEGSDDSNDEEETTEYDKLAKEATLNKIVTTNGITASGAEVQFVEFEMNESGNTWFITQFTGKNAPNYAVRAVQGYSAWDGVYTVWNSQYQKTITELGILICNSSEYGGISMPIYRGSKDFLNSYERGILQAQDEKGTNLLGMRYYNSAKTYVQIVGYEMIAGTNDATVTVYLYEITEEGLSLILNVSTRAGSSAHALAGTKAVIYGNAQASASSKAADEFGLSASNNPDSITFTYATPANTLAGLINGIEDEYEYKAQLKALLNITDSDNEEEGGEEGGETDSENAYTELSEVTTLNKIETDGAGNATNVQSIVFDGLSGDTWFMVQFTGNNAPNFAVRSTAQFTEWGAATTGNDAGMLITNSSYENQRSINLYRGTKTDSGTRRVRMDGTMGVGAGNECFAANKNYIMIIGYTQNASVSTSADITCYIFEILEDGVLSLIFNKTVTGTYAYNALTGTKAVIYGNIGVTANQLGPDSVTFTYAIPKSSLEELINGVADTYQYKTALKTSLEIA